MSFYLPKSFPFVKRQRPLFCPDKLYPKCVLYNSQILDELRFTSFYGVTKYIVKFLEFIKTTNKVKTRQ